MTITCHHVYNYGATLQAYALQNYLESLGHEVKIIDFNPWFHCNRYNPFWVSRKAKSRTAKLMNKIPLLKYIWQPVVAYRHSMFRTWGRKRAFDKFEEAYYHLSQTKYESIEDLRSNPPMADIYIAGSDQIWNTYSENGSEPAYYLDFGVKTIKKISYAASFATNDLKPALRSFVIKQLEKFDHISTRENSGERILEGIGIVNSKVVLDPVFLLDKNKWEELGQKGRWSGLQPNKYILVYDFLGTNNSMTLFIKSYAKEFSLPIVSINDFSPREYADININNAGPLEFLRLIRNAACVISCSFHATAFSVIFEKEFYTFSLIGQNNSSRMEDFLKLCGLINRMNPHDKSNKTIRWEDVRLLIDKQKAKSKSFLLSAIS